MQLTFEASFVKLTIIMKKMKKTHLRTLENSCMYHSLQTHNASFYIHTHTHTHTHTQLYRSTDLHGLCKETTQVKHRYRTGRGNNRKIVLAGSLSKCNNRKANTFTGYIYIYIQPWNRNFVLMAYHCTHKIHIIIGCAGELLPCAATGIWCKEQVNHTFGQV